MHINDFHSRLVAAEESPLLQALRALSQVEDPKSLTDQTGILEVDWPAWPGTGAGVSPQGESQPIVPVPAFPGTS